MSKRRTRRDRLTILKDLVENLTDRDVKLKRDMNLFEGFFKNFPIPVTIWAISSDGTVMSQRGNGLISENASSLENLFFDSDVKKICIDAHREALKGEPVQKVVNNCDKIYYVSIVPRKNEQGEISGVLGLSWDITSNHIMLENLNDIKNISSEKTEGCYMMIRNLAETSINVSRLNTLVHSCKDKK
jgi:hypothetical protein